MHVVYEKDPLSRFGAFEVELDGVLIHSKLNTCLTGDGNCETEEELGYVIAKVCAALNL